MNRGFIQMQAETSSFYNSAPETQVFISEYWIADQIATKKYYK